MTNTARIVVDNDGLYYDASRTHYVRDGLISSRTGRYSWQVHEEGVYLNLSKSPMRTKGEPVTLRRIKETVGTTLTFIAPDPLRAKVLAALIATESGGNSDAARFETHINDWSFGMCQLLTKTVGGLYKRFKHHLPKPPDPIDVMSQESIDEWKAFLANPTTSIQYANAYLTNCANGSTDPIILYAMYNAGGVYFSSDNLWGLRSAPGALDRFAAWYGDACEVFR